VCHDVFIQKKQRDDEVGVKGGGGKENMGEKK
jgi:hypothetical protein